jgi:hypothetical protein
MSAILEPITVSLRVVMLFVLTSPLSGAAAVRLVMKAVPLPLSTLDKGWITVPQSTNASPETTNVVVRVGLVPTWILPKCGNVVV